VCGMIEVERSHREGSMTGELISTTVRPAVSAPRPSCRMHGGEAVRREDEPR